MKQGYFAIGEGLDGRDVWLICEYRRPKSDEPRKNGVIYGYVVNGAWDFTLEGGILTVLATGTTHEAEIIWKGWLPDGLMTYRDVSEYIERRLSRWAITNYLIDRAILTHEYGRRVKRAWKAAVRNFKVVYRENSKFVEDESDTIPF